MAAKPEQGSGSGDSTVDSSAIVTNERLQTFSNEFKAEVDSEIENAIGLALKTSY